MTLGIGTIFMGIMIVGLLCTIIARVVKFSLAWYFAFHFGKKFKPLHAHMRPPGWHPRTCKTPTIA